MINSKNYLLSLAVIAMSVCFQSCKNPAGSGSGMNISGKESFADSAVSTVRLLKDDMGREVLQKNNTYYDLVDFIDKQDLKKIILKITKSEIEFLQLI